MKFSVRDIVMSNGIRPKGAFVVMAIHPSRPKNPYSILSLTNGRKYHGGDIMFKDKRIGVADESFLNSDVDTVIGTVEAKMEHEELQEGKARAAREMKIAPFNSTLWRQWQALYNANTGDIIKIRRPRGIEDGVFHTVMTRGHVYHFLASIKGKLFKFPVGSVHIPTPT